MSEELKPLACPFCGSDKISTGEVLTEYPNGKVTTQSQCDNCKALGAEAELEPGQVDYGDIEATAGWNRRAAQPSQPVADELHKMLDHILTAMDRRAVPTAWLSLVDAAGKKFIERSELAATPSSSAALIRETLERAAKYHDDSAAELRKIGGWAQNEIARDHAIHADEIRALTTDPAVEAQIRDAAGRQA